jgi:hypothetical protein
MIWRASACAIFVQIASHEKAINITISVSLCLCGEQERMPNLNRTQRNTLRHIVTACRRLLEDETASLLEGQYGIHRTGRIEKASALRQLSSAELTYREQVLQHLRHLAAAAHGGERRVSSMSDERAPADVVEQLIREVAFTHLNRLCAFKMLEYKDETDKDSHRLIREAVGRGWKSNGFQFYLGDHPEDEARSNGGQQDLAYRNFLIWQATELSRDLVALFSPLDIANRLFPRQRVLDELLAQINSPELAEIWAVPETIGWIYQYFTPRELRERARKESQAPRNSYELAFRNQFYTPAYVVAFLADNTLGRIWYEMRWGDTALTSECALLVFRPNEVFLAEGETAPVDSDGTSYVPFRAKRDPRDLHVLDPACGSGHFLIYCYGLLETIYREAYDDTELGPALQAGWPQRDAFEQAIPALILEHNLHGIDIDLRAVQIASLALYLRAHSGRSRPKGRDTRHAIRRANLVCAEPMPGDRAVLDEFLAAMPPAEGLATEQIGALVRAVFEQMQLADEAGSLLKIDGDLNAAIMQARRKAIPQGQAGQTSLFAEEEQLWGAAEPEVLRALADYAAHAAEGDYRRQLFADDAAQGFAFIDLCRKRYDVVLMNPPFGAPSRDSVKYISAHYERTKNDLYAAFVERGLDLLRPSGMLGAITSRTGFFLTSFQKWREELLLKEGRLTVVADLGMGVLDTAMVETAAYCVERVSGW